MVRDIFLIGGTVSLLLVGCTAEKPATPSPAEETTLEKEKAPSVMRETKNISYDGIVKPAGISIYQQGTHRLSLPNGKFVLLESETVDLNGYVDEHVRIFGALRPTVEAGGMIMRVERMQLLGDDKDEDTEEEVLLQKVRQQNISN